jgi:SAM-dependent methyltransferase
MAFEQDQRAYWNSAAQHRTFTHPIDAEALAPLPRTARIIDYGCGYGRSTALTAGLGFAGVEGVDPSPALIQRARREHPELKFTVQDDPPHLPYADASAEAVLLIAVLTCIPADDDQRALIGELSRVLRPGGLLAISDMLLQDDQRHRDRYDRDAARYGTYGVFEVGDGAVCRHHTREQVTGLLSGFDVTTRELTVASMRGNPVTAIQIRAIRRDPLSP